MEIDDRYEPELTQTLMKFMTNAANASSVYVKHSNRGEITSKDIKLGLMIEYYRFIEHTTIFDKVNQPELDIRFIENPTELFSYSKCNCKLCYQFNKVEDRIIKDNNNDFGDSFEKVLKQSIITSEL